MTCEKTYLHCYNIIGFLGKMDFEWDGIKAERSSQKARILVVVFVEKLESEKIRIISARKAERDERSQYTERLGSNEK